jgi:hypothetical protein
MECRRKEGRGRRALWALKRVGRVPIANLVEVADDADSRETAARPIKFAANAAILLAAVTGI